MRPTSKALANTIELRSAPTYPQGYTTCIFHTDIPYSLPRTQDLLYLLQYSSLLLFRKHTDHKICAYKTPPMKCD